MRNMSYIVAKSCTLFHTITYIQYQVNTMHLTWENEVCQKVARICPNPRRLGILRTNFFPGPETFRNGSPALISTIPEVLSKIQRFSSWEIGQKPHFRPFWGPNLGKDILGKRQVLSFSIINRNQKNLVMVMDWQSWLHRTQSRSKDLKIPMTFPLTSLRWRYS